MSESIQGGLTGQQRELLTGRGDRRFDAYYYSFEPVGCEPIDLILAAVAWAGKAAHHTETWNDCDEHWAHYGGSPVDYIQAAARSAAATLAETHPFHPVLAESSWMWLRTFLHDTLNVDFLGEYQRECVGPIPPDVAAWAEVDADLFPQAQP